MADDLLEIYQDKRGEFRWRRTAADRWEFYKDKASGHRWRCFSTANKKQVGKATEVFSSKNNAETNARVNGYRG